MRKLARGWSAKYFKSNCTTCKKSTEHEIIQYQNKISIGPIPIMGKGPREFGKECTSCHTVGIMKDKNKIKKASKLKYTDKRQERKILSEDVNTVKESKIKKVVKYPVLNSKDRDKIIKHNKKEGYLSILLGLVIAFVIGFFNTAIALIVGVIFTLFGLYAAYEDPERKHRDFYRAGKKIQ